MSIFLRTGMKFCQSIPQAHAGKIYSITNTTNHIQSFIDVSARVDKVATSKLNFQRILKENHSPSKTYSLLPFKSYHRYYSTETQSVNTRVFPTHSFEPPASQKRTNRVHHYEKCTVSHIEDKIGFPLILLFLAIIGTMTEVHAESSINTPLMELPERIKGILNTLPQERSVDDVIELFNYLHDKGEEEAKKAIGKDVVIVFGDTGAGKSTLLNFLWGCKMRKNPHDPRIIEVDPASEIPEIAPIGQGPRSSTLIPKMIGDLKYYVSPQISEPFSDMSLREESALTFYDMPGFSDNRGFEVELAAAITMKKIVKNAKSVKFMMVFEYPITSSRGKGWAETAILYTQRFSGIQWKEDQSLSLVITKVPADVPIALIKKDIERCTPNKCINLSDCISTYDPLNPHDQKEQLDIISKINTYKLHDINIVMKKDQLWESHQLVDKLEKSIYDDLEKDRMDHAKKTMKFAQGIAELENEDLSRLYKTASNGVHRYINDLLSLMEKAGHSPEIRYPYLKKYIAIRNNFSAYTHFSRHNSDAIQIRNQISDERRIAWDKPNVTIVGAVSTTGAGALTGFGIVNAVGASALSTTLSGAGLVTAITTAVTAVPVIAIVGGAATVGGLAFTAYAGLRWLKPSDKDVITSAYFDEKI